MSHLTSNFISNNSSLFIQNPSDSPPPSIPIKNSINHKIYLGPGSTNVPGLTHLFCAPYELIQSTKALIKANQIHDTEGLIENGLRVVSTPFNFFSSLARLAWYAVRIEMLTNPLSGSLNPLLIPLSTTIGIFSFIVCTIEGILETISLIRSIKFYNNTHVFNFETLKKNLIELDPTKRKDMVSKCLNHLIKDEIPSDLKIKIEEFLVENDLSTEEFDKKTIDFSNQLEEIIYLNRLNKLQNKYLQISQKKTTKTNLYLQKKFSHLHAEQLEELKGNLEKEILTKKYSRLARRIQPWLADEIKLSTPQLIQDLQSHNLLQKNRAKEKASEIFNQIKIQSHKKIVIHSIGLAAVLITIAGLIASCITCPFLIPLIIMLVGGGLAITRYYLHEGFINSRGWHFNGANCVPKVVKSIYEKIITKKVITDPLNFSTSLYLKLPPHKILWLENSFTPKPLNFKITVSERARLHFQNKLLNST